MCIRDRRYSVQCAPLFSRPPRASISSCTILTVTASLNKGLRKVDIRIRLGLLEFKHKMLVADIVNEVILGTDIMNGYGFVVDLKENALMVGEGKI